MNKNYGQVNNNEAVIFLTNQAYADNYQNTVRYYGNGIDAIGRKYNITWELNRTYQEYCELEDESEACDWESPIKIELVRKFGDI